MKPKGFFVRVLSSSLCFVFLFTNCLFAHKPQANIWKERRDALERNRPTSHGPAGDNVAPKQAPLQLAQLPLPLNRPQLPSVINSLSLESNPLSSSSILDETKLAGLGEEAASLLRSPSPAHVSLRGISAPSHAKNGRTIVHIQDVHTNGEAQRNIGAAIEELAKNKKVDLIALEGASGLIDLSSFRAFPHRTALRQVVNCLLKENKISGPIHTALTAEDDLPPIVGVDDPANYQANVEAYRQASPLMESQKTDLSNAGKSLEKEKSRTFNPDLLTFDALVQAYRDEKLSFGEYVKLLKSKIITGESRNDIDIFLSALELESSLNFVQVERERTYVLEKLTRKLSPEDTTQLINATLAYRLGKLSHSNFYTLLSTLCERSGVQLEKTPAMKSYIDYVLLSDRIEADALFRETRELEKAIYEKLAKTGEEKRLIKDSRRLYLTGKLLDFALTPEEWGELSTVIPAQACLAGRRAGIQGYVKGLDPDFRRDDDYRAIPPSFLSFYRLANLRNEAMAKNLLQTMEARGAKVAVLVTGGFHSKDLNRLLEDSGSTILTFTPKLTAIDTKQGSAYLSVFTQEKTPLEKLFVGDKLFLAIPPFPRAVRLLAGVLTAVGAHLLHLSRSISDSLRQLLPIDYKEIEVTFKEEKDPNAAV
ncbi:MAG: hypothetical protein LHV69_11910, partial [Elusimicrobia bacterium]|nr:hypothetical protein [Candidatus Obscuribacterium magneticum]